METSGLGMFDIAVFLVIGISTLMAFFKGFLQTVGSFFTWLASIFCTLYLYSPVKDVLASHMSNEKAAMVAAGAGVFILVFILCSIISSYIVNALHSIGLGPVDKTLGFAFGLVRGVALVAAVYFGITLAYGALGLSEDKEKPGPKWLTEAKTYNFVKVSTGLILDTLPGDFEKTLQASLKNASKSILTSESVASLLGSEDAPKLLNDEQRSLMLRVIAAMPESEVKDIYQRYEGNTSDLSELERMAVFRDIADNYEKEAAQGKIDKDNLVDKEDFEALQRFLRSNPQEHTSQDEDKDGYKKQQLQQLDRLVDTIN